MLGLVIAAVAFAGWTAVELTVRAPRVGDTQKAGNALTGRQTDIWRADEITERRQSYAVGGGIVTASLLVGALIIRPRS